jgi:hypothetical protein
LTLMFYESASLTMSGSLCTMAPNQFLPYNDSTLDATERCDLCGLICLDYDPAAIRIAIEESGV